MYLFPAETTQTSLSCLSFYTVNFLQFIHCHFFFLHLYAFITHHTFIPFIGNLTVEMAPKCIVILP